MTKAADDRRGGPRRVGMISLGCAKNRVDAEVMLGELRSRGYEVVADVDEADTVIVNTCGFIESAKQESIDAILEVAEQRGAGLEETGRKRLLVAGCMANRYGAELKREIPEIDGFVSLDQLQEVSSLVQLGGAGPPAEVASSRLFDHRNPRLLTTSGYAYLKVAEGCNNPCTFCAIPVWRGRLRSRSIESLVTEAQRLESEGIRELCLVAQDTTRFGEDLGLGRHGLLRLVEALLDGTTVPWIRFLYAYPTTLDEDLLKLMGTEQRFTSYLDMPLQHSHPGILKAMRRGGRAERYSRILDRARELVPEIALRTTFITGFPGEREEHFEHLLAFVERSRFDHLGAFTYSPEEDTPSARLPDRPSPEVAEERRLRLLESQRPIALERRQRLVGRRLAMLVEGPCDETEHLLVARHQGMAPEIDGRVLINDTSDALRRNPVGDIVEVEITEAYADDLVGRILGPAAGAAGDPEEMGVGAR